MRFRIRDYAYPLKILSYRRLMRQAPTWPSARLDEWIRERRMDIVRHAYRTVPHYRQLFDRHGIRPEQTDDPAVWTGIPTLTKETICEQPDSLISSSAEAAGGVWARTSGSTGLQLRILLDRDVNAAAFALFWRAWGSGGYYRLGQRHAVMKGLSHGAGWRYNRPIRALELSAARINADSAGFFRDLLLRYRPRFMRGHPSAMYLFCRLLREQGLELHIPMIISGSEMLHDFQRQEIESFFGARLYNHYTHWERAASILECEAGRLHAQQDYGFHEIVDEQGKPVGPGVPGMITVTTLHNRAMPLIRYRTGDIGVWAAASCSCGQVLPVVDRIEGRQTDNLVTRRGAVIPGMLAHSVLKLLPHVLYSQIVQYEAGRVELRIVRTKDYREPDDTREISRAMQEQLGADMQIEVRCCGLEDLERSPVGKIRTCFNRIPPEQLTGMSVSVNREPQKSEADTGAPRMS